MAKNRITKLRSILFYLYFMNCFIQSDKLKCVTMKGLVLSWCNQYRTTNNISNKTGLEQLD